MHRLGIEVGESFTDFVLTETTSSAVHFFKLISTPDYPSVAIANGVRELLEPFSVRASDASFLGHAATTHNNCHEHDS